jgi:hypothetical protein
MAQPATGTINGLSAALVIARSIIAKILLAWPLRRWRFLDGGFDFRPLRKFQRDV